MSHHRKFSKDIKLNADCQKDARILNLRSRKITVDPERRPRTRLTALKKEFVSSPNVLLIKKHKKRASFIKTTSLTNLNSLKSNEKTRKVTRRVKSAKKYPIKSTRTKRKSETEPVEEVSKQELVEYNKSTPANDIKLQTRLDTGLTPEFAGISIDHDLKAIRPTPVKRQKVLPIIEEKSNEDQPNDKTFVIKKDEKQIINVELQQQNLDKAIATINQTTFKWKTILSETQIPEEQICEINANIGKYALLKTKKFKQFQSLINKVANQLEEEGKLMTTNDLNGLWDIITIQLEQIGDNFEKLEKLSKCDWKVETVENNSIPNPKQNSKPIKPLQNKNKTEKDSIRQKAARERMMAFKKQMKEKMSKDKENLDLVAS